MDEHRSERTPVDKIVAKTTTGKEKEDGSGSREGQN